MHSIVLYTKPIPVNQRYSIQNGRNLLSKKYREAKQALQTELLTQRPAELIDGDLSVNILLYVGDNRKRDIDSYIKILLDSMEGYIYKDDSAINELHVIKQKDLDNPRVEIQVL